MNNVKAFCMEYRQDIKKSNNISNSILIYYIVAFVATIIVAIVEESLKINNISYWFYGIFLLVTFLFYYKYKVKKVEICTWPKRNIDLKIFLLILGINLARSTIIYDLIRIIYYLLGEDSIPGTFQGMDYSFDKIIYIILIGPIVEEIMFRGAGLSLFNKEDNKIEAIIFTSILFGLTHGNFAQALNSAIGGFIYGYVTIEFGILYSILFHIISNSLSYAQFSLNISALLLIISFCIVIFLMLYGKKYYKNIITNLKCNKTFSCRRVLAYFMNPFIIVHSAVCLFFIIISLVAIFIKI